MSLLPRLVTLVPRPLGRWQQCARRVCVGGASLRVVLRSVVSAPIIRQTETVTFPDMADDRATI